MSGFLGEYEIAMDAKGRFLMPAGFRKQLPDAHANSFVVSRGMESCVTLYTKEGWDLVSEKINKLNDFVPRVQKFKRLFLSGATLVELDAAGRLLLPKPLQEHAGLKKDLVFSTQGSKVEIWDKDTYYAYLNAHQDDFSGLAEELLGGSFIDPF
jgi:MraZ protein